MQNRRNHTKIDNSIVREIPIGAIGRVAPRLHKSAYVIDVPEALVPENGLLGAAVFLVGIVRAPTRCDVVHGALKRLLCQKMYKTEECAQ